MVVPARHLKASWHLCVWPTLVVIGHYYLLFAVMGSSTPVLALESLASAAFLARAVIGFKRSLWLTAAALAGHGIFDFFHHLLIENPRPGMVARLLHVLRRSRRRSSCRAPDATLRIRSPIKHYAPQK
jgi:hypothetical protein